MANRDWMRRKFWTRSCEDCGADFQTVGDKALRCQSCRDKRRQADDQEKLEMLKLMKEMDARKKAAGVKW